MLPFLFADLRAVDVDIFIKIDRAIDIDIDVTVVPVEPAPSRNAHARGNPSTECDDSGSKGIIIGRMMPDIGRIMRIGPACLYPQGQLTLH